MNFPNEQIRNKYEMCSETKRKVRLLIGNHGMNKLHCTGTKIIQ
jgi:hypothetical protein